MPRISFARGNRESIEVEKSSNLMQALLDAMIPVASSCHGEAVCGKCIIQVSKGAENLTPETDDESFLKDRLNLKKHIRVSCQAKVLGDIEIDATYW